MMIPGNRYPFTKGGLVLDNIDPDWKGAGSVLGYGDGSATWKNLNQLQNVGSWTRGRSDRKLYSLPPRD